MWKFYGVRIVSHLSRSGALSICVGRLKEENFLMCSTPKPMVATGYVFLGIQAARLMTPRRLRLLLQQAGGNVVQEVGNGMLRWYFRKDGRSF
jgi:hypothetical protein